MAIFFLVTNRYRLKRVVYLVLLIYLIYNFLIELIANILDANNFSNLELYNFGMISEVLFFLTVYYISFESFFLKRVIIYTGFFFAGFSCINAFLFQSYHSFFSNTYTVGSVLLMAVSLYYLVAVVLRNEELSPVHTFMFWFSIGVLFCYLGNLPYLSVLNNLLSTDNKAMARNLALISMTVNTLLYILIVIGAICNRTSPK